MSHRHSLTLAEDNISILLSTNATAVLCIVLVEILITNGDLAKPTSRPFLHNKLLQVLNVSRTYIIVDIKTIRPIINYISISPSASKSDFAFFLELPWTQSRLTILDLLERIDTQKNHISHIAVVAYHIFHCAIDMLMISKGHL